MRTHFRYKTFRGRPVPMITIGIRMRDRWYPVEVYVDSGATYTVLHARMAESAGLEYLAGQQIYLQVGDGSFIPVYLHELEMQLGAERFTGTVGFSNKLGIGFNLLGTTSVFDRFQICFLERQRLLTFEAPDVPTG